MDWLAKVQAPVFGGKLRVLGYESENEMSTAAVAQAGDVMPPKSTYFYPKALSGLVINPHEW